MNTILGIPSDKHEVFNRVFGGGGGGAPAATGAAGAAVGGAGGYPLGAHGPIIGRPHQGTHTLGNWQSDNAVDISVPRGTPALSAIAGGVTKVSFAPEGGRISGDSITICGSGQCIFYTHLSAVNVKTGDTVQVGSVIGATGVAGVPHLHFGVQNGSPFKYVGGN